MLCVDAATRALREKAILLSLAGTAESQIIFEERLKPIPLPSSLWHVIAAF
jgi:hypothetical protein